MIQLTVLGDVDLRTADGTVAGSVLSQPRRLALLVYLAVESAGGGVQRERLLGVFWPDLPQDQGRTSLRTALHFLRRSLGPDVITSQGGAVALNPASISCDATGFAAALDAEDTEEALRVYRGDLLPGFYLDDGPPDFERWAEEKRGELRRAAATAAWSLAGEQERAGNAPGAGAWARRAARLFHGDEAAVRRSIELLGRIGDRAGALEAYQDLSHRLRDEFDASPSPETDAAIARVRCDDGGSEEFRDPAAAPIPAGPPVAIPAPAVASRPRTRLRRFGRTVYSGAVTVVLMLAFYSLWGLNRGDPSATPTRVAPVIQVEDLRDFSTDGSAAALAGALTLELTARLSDSDAFQVISLAGAPAPVVAPTSHPANYIVRAGVMLSQSQVRVTAVLVDAVSGATMDRITAEHAIDGPVVAADIAEVMARRIRREVGRAVDDLERGASANNLTALALVRAAVKDREAADSLRLARAPDAARVALAAADSQLALAHSVAPRWVEPSVQRAEIAYRQMWLRLLPPFGDSEGAAAAVRAGLQHTATALAVRPNDAAAQELAGVLNYWLWRLRGGGSEALDQDALNRAEAHLRKATRLDAGRGRAWSVLSALLETRGDFAAANLAAGRAYRADAYLENTREILVRLFNTSLEVGDLASAGRWCDELSQGASDRWFSYYCALELIAWQGNADAVAADSIQRLVESGTAAAPPALPIHARIHMLGAVALARTGSPAARDFMEAARDMSAPDPHLLALEAWAHVALGDDSVAAQMLERAMGADPRGSHLILKSRRFAALRAS